MAKVKYPLSLSFKGFPTFHQYECCKHITSQFTTNKVAPIAKVGLKIGELITSDILGELHERLPITSEIGVYDSGIFTGDTIFSAVRVGTGISTPSFMLGNAPCIMLTFNNEGLARFEVNNILEWLLPIIDDPYRCNPLHIQNFHLDLNMEAVRTVVSGSTVQLSNAYRNNEYLITFGARCIHALRKAFFNNLILACPDFVELLPADRIAPKHLTEYETGCPWGVQLSGSIINRTLTVALY